VGRKWSRTYRNNLPKIAENTVTGTSQ